jgi:D-sedoheptulose 7-phosphate isomerase
MVVNFTQAWIDALARVSAATIVSGDARNAAFTPVTLDAGVLKFRHVAANRTSRGGRIILIGNGGSLAIAMHIATDFALAGWPAIAFGDPVALTSHTNDFGSEANFSKQFELIKLSYADMVVAMSCSGKSANIIDAVKFARAAGNYVVTLTGFEPDNPLRLLGSLNFYVPASEYGFVQLAHESVLHAACDIENGWSP